MAVKINELKGMTQELEAKLKEHNIRNSDQLLQAASTAKQRKELASSFDVDVRTILELVNRADLSRVKGVGGVFSDLLEQAGVDTVKELATRRVDNLFDKIIETNSKGEFTKQPPVRSQVESWVQQAKDLPKMVEY